MLGLVQVPSTSEAVDGKGVYTVFDVHLNGNYHGSARYSQLLTFHQELKVKYDMKGIEEFPGKHWFTSLSTEQLYTRRVGIERYLHSLAQDKQIGVSSELKEFFIAMQRSCSELSDEDGAMSEVFLEVFLVNGKSVTVRVEPFLRTDQVLEAVTANIQLAKELTYYFNLFLEKQEGEEQTWTVIRPLTDFECPYVSLQTLNKTSPHRVTIRKNFWDKAFLAEVLADKVGKNLLYIECLWSVTSGHWDILPHVQKQLATLQKKSQKKEYVELVGSLSQYGFVQLGGFVLDHPEDLYTVSVRVGKLEMVTYVPSGAEKKEKTKSKKKSGASPTEDSGDLVKVQTYPLTRIRSWKVGGKWNTPSPSWKAPWMRFFYQVGAADFIPITMQGPQAIFLSNCLHSIVDELLRIRNSRDIRRPSDTGIDRQIYSLPKVVFYEPSEVLQDRREGKDLDKDEEDQTDAPASPAPDTPTASTATSTSATPSTPVLSKTASSKRDPSPQTTPTTTPTVESKPMPTDSGKPSKSSRSSDQPALLSKAKQQVMAIIKRDSVTPSAVENPTFDFGTDDDL